MPFLIKSKFRNVTVRVGNDLIHIGPKKWIRFDKLPNGIDANGDRDLEVANTDERIINDTEINKSPVIGKPNLSGIGVAGDHVDPVAQEPTEKTHVGIKRGRRKG